MPRTQRQRTDGMTRHYPLEWTQIARRIKEMADWRCERCRHVHDVEAGYCLTVHHLDMDKGNCADWNLAALCQRCHLSVQSRVDFYQGWMLEHSGWMRSHVEGFLREMGGGHA